MAWQQDLKRIQDETYKSGKSSFYDSELARANKVIADRKAQGLDVAGQLKYLQQLSEANALGQTKREAQGAGADPNNVDTGYVRARAGGAQQNYVDNVLNTPQTTYSQPPQPTYTPPSQPTAYTPPVTNNAYKAPDFTKQVNDIYSPMISSNLSSLKAAYDKARGDVNAQIPGIRQEARQARTLNETDYMKSLPDLYRAMEAAGQKGGENITGNIALQTMRGQNLGGINQTEMNNLAALQKAIADLNAEQPLKETEIQQKGLSEQAQALMDAQKYGLDYALKVADRTGNIEVAPGVSMPTLEAQKYGSDVAYRNKAFDYGVSQDALSRSDTLSQRNLDNLYRQDVFNYNSSRDAVQDTQWQQSMNLNLRQQSFNETQQKIQNALAQKRISQEDASQALQWAKYNTEKDPMSFDNQLKARGAGYITGGTVGNPTFTVDEKNPDYTLKQQQIDINKASKLSSAENLVIDNYNKIYTSITDDGLGNKSVVINKKGILDSLKASTQNKTMTEAEAKKIAAYYGISL